MAGRSKDSVWTWPLVVTLFLFLVSIFGFPLPQEVWWPMLGGLVPAGMVGGVVWFWRKIDVRGRIADGNSWLSVALQIAIPGFVRGAIAGIAACSAVGILNGLLAFGPASTVDGVVVGRAAGSRRKSAAVYVRDPRTDFTFRVTVPDISASLTPSGGKWPIVVRRGLFGWPYLVK
jgi:hypothetical protein